MGKPSALLLAAPVQEQLIESISRRLNVTGVIGMGGTSRFRSLASPVFADIDSALAQARPDVVCFLAPSGRTGELMRQAIDNGLPVLSAGPPDMSARAWRGLSDQVENGGSPLVWGRRFAYSEVHCRLLEQRVQPAMGTPVYLRCVGGGDGGLLATWWSLCEMVEQAVALLGADPVHLYVSAKSARRRCHALATVVMANKASAQLIAIPSSFPCSGDLTLLCGGGLLTSHTAFGGPVGDRSGRSPDYWLATPDLTPEPEWLADFAGHCVRAADPPFATLSTYPAQRAILVALRSALKCGEVVEARAV
jgi:predicted dehydrogenase